MAREHYFKPETDFQGKKQVCIYCNTTMRFIIDASPHSRMKKHYWQYRTRDGKHHITTPPCEPNIKAFKVTI